MFILSKLLQGVSAEWHMCVCIYIFIYMQHYIYTPCPQNSIQLFKAGVEVIMH